MTALSTTALYENDPFRLAARILPFWICSGLSTIPYGIWSSKRRTIRAPMAVSFTILAAGIGEHKRGANCVRTKVLTLLFSAGLAAIQPDSSTLAVCMNGLAGLGFGAPLILIIAGVQLSTPHHLIATSTAVVVSARAVGASTFTAIYAAALAQQTAKKIPSYVASAALGAGLPPTSLGAFIGALAGQQTQVLPTIPGVTPQIIGAGVGALKQALADSFRVIYIIAAPFAIVGAILSLCAGDLTKAMNYKVEAPVEDLHARQAETGKA